MSNRKGFALIEVLVAVLTVCICIPIMVSVISLMRTSLKDRTSLQDQIALVQLRRYLAVAYDIELLPSSLTFQRQHEEMRLSVVNQNLIVQPGTQMFLMDIEAALFYLEGDSVMLRYVRDNQEYEVFLCKQ
ncbi:MAG: type II secretion system protein [Solobacterium sp.]|nr:type II secretion system protein [Solobacterium sp.]